MTVSWTEVGHIGARQHGVLTRAQLVTSGATPEQIKGLVRRGQIEVAHRGVYLLSGSLPSAERDTLAAVLGAGDGAVASHRSAAWLWGLVPEPPDRPEVTVPSPRFARLHGVDVHRADDWSERWIKSRKAVPATDPLRTMLMLGAVCRPYEVSDSLERGVIAGLFSIAALEWVRAELAERGRNGCGVLRELLDERALGRARPDGMLEPRMAQLCARFGVKRPQFQYRVVDEQGRFVAKVDFAYPEVRAFLEVDGYEVHGTPEAMEKDFDRQNQLVALGWVPIRFGWRLLIRQPHIVASQILSVLATLRAG